MFPKYCIRLFIASIILANVAAAHAQDAITWSGSYSFENGYAPAVALSGSLAVEVHQSGSGTSPLWYSTGQLQPNGSIKWNSSAPLANGYRPSIALSGTTVLLVYQNAIGGSSSSPLSYCVGHIQADGSTQWNDALVYANGFSPSVAIAVTGGSTNVVEVHQSNVNSSLYYCTGQIEPTNVYWINCANYDNGYAPSVAMSGNSVFEVHQANSGAGALWYHVGTVQSNNTVSWSGSVQYSMGLTPRVALWGTTITELHAAAAGTTALWAHTAEIAGTSVTWNSTSNYDSGSVPSLAISGRNLIEMHMGAAGALWYHTGKEPEVWTKSTNFDASGAGAGTALLLTDGSVLMQDASNRSNWWRLTPDSSGSYINGSWQQMPSLPSGYTPLYYASAVLSDGKVIIEGGEYNGISGIPVDSAMGAIYDPEAYTWTTVNPPSGWSTIGDATSAVLADGTFMLANCCSGAYPEWAYLNEATLTWSNYRLLGKADTFDEEGWALLPNGKLLTVDYNDPLNSELYDPTTTTWSSAGSTIVNLANGELGPIALRPDGTVFVPGGNTSYSAIYNTATGTWSQGPNFPVINGNQFNVADGPAAVLPNGNVLMAASPGLGTTGPLQMFEFDGTNITPAANPLEIASQPASYTYRLLILPSGQILSTDGYNHVEIYTPSGTYNTAWAPIITQAPSTITAGMSSYSISGTQFNGLTQGSVYGDDAQMATNYPLVRIVNNASLHVFYARTHNHSTMGVATGSAVVSTKFDAPLDLEAGPCTISVVANGIPSAPVQASCIQYE